MNDSSTHGRVGRIFKREFWLFEFTLPYKMGCVCVCLGWGKGDGVHLALANFCVDFWHVLSFISCFA